MTGRLLLVLVLGTALGSLAQTAQDVTEVRAAVAKIEAQARKVSKSHSFQGRRLQSMPDIDFSSLCTSKCWAAIKTSMIKMVVDVEKNCGKDAMKDPACDKSKTGDAPPPDDSSSEAEQCLFDMGKMSLGPEGTLAEVCTKGVVKTLGPDTMYKMDMCMLSSFDFICDAILSTACATDNTQERKLFCQPPSKDDEPEDPPDCDAPKSSEQEAMTDNFNQMCSYNPTGKFYCQQEAAAWEKKGAFKEEPEEIFPNPCDITCDNPTGKAIAAMGCCLGSLIAGSEKHGHMSAKALRSAKAATFKCGGMKAMQVCSGANSGMIKATKIFAGKQSVDTCPTTSAAEKKVKAALAKTLDVTPGSLSLMACVPAGSSCEGGSRRVAATGNTIHFATTVSGSDAVFAAKEKAVTAKIATVSGGKTGDTSKTGATVTTAANTVAAGCSSMSLPLGILALSFIASCAM